MRCLHTFVRWSRIARCALSIAALLCLASPGIADYQKVGKIVIDKRALAGGGRKGPGADIIAHWELADTFKKQTLFEESKLRWLQRLSCSDAVGLLTPRLNRPFIDPRKGQLAPGHPDGEGDDLPFYDFSYPSLNDATKNENIKINGSGAYLRDDPRAQVGQTSIRFEFMTLVVGIQDDMQFTALGGFTWGFDVDRAAKHTLLPVEMISAETIALGRFTDVNDSLRNDFAAWGLPSQKSYSANTQYYLDLSMVPEPATLCHFIFSIVLVTSRMRPRSRPGIAGRAAVEN
jgi:hypothetical protein